MHELSYVTELYKRLSQEQLQITDIFLTVSNSSGIEDDSFILYWKTMVRNTKLTHATLHIAKLPQILQCTQCQLTFTSTEEDILLEPCPACKSHKTMQTDLPSVTIDKIIYETNKSNQ